MVGADEDPVELDVFRAQPRDQSFVDPGECGRVEEPALDSTLVGDDHEAELRTAGRPPLHLRSADQSGSDR
jgi:hypothetical protein